jgi:basic membrane protein A
MLVEPVSATTRVPVPAGHTAARPWLLSLAGLAVGMLLCLGAGLTAFALRDRLGALLAPAAASATSPGVGPTAATAPLPTSAPTQAEATQALVSEETTTPLSATDVPAALVPTATLAASLTSVPVTSQKVCAVSDIGGFEDRSFNQRVLDGLRAVEANLGWNVATLEAQSADDYFPHLATFVNDDCDLIIAVGFLMADVTSGVATAHPDERLVILDFEYEQPHPNVWQAVYAVDQAAFLAGYAAAAASRSGVVGTFGGIDIAPVIDFMDGFALGVAYYNEQKGTDVKVLGWDPAHRDQGTFIGNFDSTDDGYAAATAMMDQGADVILPVAGPASFGAAQAALDHDGVYVIGVDTDWTVRAPEYREVILTSVLKQLDMTVQQAVEAVQAGTFAGGVHVGTLENGGVGLAPFDEDGNLLPEGIHAELLALQGEIGAGRVQTKP